MTGKNIDWKKNKTIVFESDDWGAMTCPNLETLKKIRNSPEIAPAIERYKKYHFVDSLESVEDLDRLFKVLLQFKGADGRPPVFTAIYFLANPDYDAIRANGLTKYVDRGIDKEYPPVFKGHGDIIGKAKEGMKLGVWVPESHTTRGDGHLDLHKWVKMLREKKDPARKAFFDLNMIGVGTPTAPHKGEEYDSMEKEEIGEWLRVGAQYFYNAFGYRPRACGLSSARVKCKVLERIVAEFLAANGTELIFNAENREMCEYDPELGLVFIQRNAFLEPAGGVSTWQSCYEQVLKAWDNNQPAVISTHRCNYCTLDPDEKAEDFNQLEKFLSIIRKEHPDAVYRHSCEIARLVKS